MCAIVLWFVAREPFARGLAMALLIMAGLGLSARWHGLLRQRRTVAAVDRAAAREPCAVRRRGRFAHPVVGGKSFAQYRIGYAVAVLLALFFVFVMGKLSQHGFAVGLLLLAALGSGDRFLRPTTRGTVPAGVAGGRYRSRKPIDRAGIRSIYLAGVRDRIRRCGASILGIEVAMSLFALRLSGYRLLKPSAWPVSRAVLIPGHPGLSAPTPRCACARASASSATGA